MKKSSKILLIIAMNAFVIGLTEFISVGLIPMFVEDFSISESLASMSVTFYAIGVIIGAPLLSTITNSFNRKNVLILVMCIFILGNGIVILAENFNTLLLGRFISAFAHGLFMTSASAIAAGVVKEEQKSSAIAIMFTGLTVATIFGVPFGTFLANFLSWQSTFTLITLLGAIILIMNLIFIPNDIKNEKSSKLKEQFELFKSSKVLIIFLITTLAYGSTFIVYTFISVLLKNVGYLPMTITFILFIYGIMVAIGNTLGGKFTNNNTLDNLQKIILVQSLILLTISFTFNSKILILISIILMGLFAFMNVPGLQLIVLKRAKEYTPNSVNLASAFNISAFNLGIAGGSFIGSLLIINGTIYLGLFSCIIALLSVLLIQVTK